MAWSRSGATGSVAATRCEQVIAESINGGGGNRSEPDDLPCRLLFEASDLGRRLALSCNNTQAASCATPSFRKRRGCVCLSRDQVGEDVFGRCAFLRSSMPGVRIVRPGLGAGVS